MSAPLGGKRAVRRMLTRCHHAKLHRMDFAGGDFVVKCADCPAAVTIRDADVYYLDRNMDGLAALVRKSMPPRIIGMVR